MDYSANLVLQLWWSPWSYCLIIFWSWRRCSPPSICFWVLEAVEGAETGFGHRAVPTTRTLYAGGHWFPWVSGGVVTALIVSGFGWLMPARSAAGMRALANIRGFKDFLTRVEADHIERLESTPQVFEKYLPFAMAFSIDEKRAESFAGVAVPPQRYRGKGNGFFP